jgi:hypothetical protein
LEKWTRMNGKGKVGHVGNVPELGTLETCPTFPFACSYLAAFIPTSSAEQHIKYQVGRERPA